MGIDVYLKWDKQTEEDYRRQITGFSVTSGHTGYLREAYHGGPYATPVLISEDWDDQPEEGFEVPAAKLRERLPAAVLVALFRNHVVYEQGEDPSKATEATIGRKLGAVFAELKAGIRNLNTFTPNEEQIRAVSDLIAARKLPDYALSFVDFVELADKMEKATGKPCRVVVSA